MLTGYVQGMAESDPVAAIDAALSCKNDEQYILVINAAEAAARQGAGSAKAVLERVAAPDQRRFAAVMALQILAYETKADPFTFINDTIGLDQLGSVADRMYFGLRFMVSSHPEETANWAAQLPDKVRPEILNHTLVEWSNRDPDSALAWITKKQEAAETSIAEAAQLFRVNQLLADGKTNEAIATLPQVTRPGRLVNMVADQLARETPEAAGQWLSWLPESKARQEAAERVTRSWAESDLSSASEWVQQLSSGETKDTAANTMISVIAQRDPESASHWIGLISAPNQRMDGIARVYGYWSGRDPAAAREWVKTVPDVDERWRARFLRKNE
jgi:hypothetical protein